MQGPMVTATFVCVFFMNKIVNDAGRSYENQLMYSKIGKKIKGLDKLHIAPTRKHEELREVLGDEEMRSALEAGMGVQSRGSGDRLRWKKLKRGNWPSASRDRA